MKCLICNLKYSPNLGDGALAVCLEHEIARQSHWTVRTIDLAGRTAWRAPQRVGLRTMALKALHGLPNRLSEFAFESMMSTFVRRRLIGRWKDEVSNADLVLIGGGQLLQDGDLNFPVKIGSLFDVCRKQRKPLGIIAVGIGEIRSRRGQDLFAPLFQSDLLVYASARDEGSRVAAQKRGLAVEICPDPALLAARVWPAPPVLKRPKPLIGLGITHPAVLSHHATFVSVGLADAIAIYRNIIHELTARGFDVECFTNGAGEDEACLTGVIDKWNVPRGHEGQISRAPRANTPERLAQRIASYDAVVAHRLHAAILGYAYARPIVGLRWDSKLQALFDNIGQSSCVVDFTRGNEATISDAVDSAVRNGVDLNQRQQTIEAVERGIARALECLKSAPRASKREAA